MSDNGDRIQGYSLGVDPPKPTSDAAGKKEEYCVIVAFGGGNTAVDGEPAKEEPGMLMVAATRLAENKVCTKFGTYMLQVEGGTTSSECLLGKPS